MLKMRADWGDMDYNAHMANAAYLHKSGTARMLYFSENGFPMKEFARLGVGPVILRDEADYYRELRLLDEFTVTTELSGMSPDGKKFRIRNAFIRADGKTAAVVTSRGAWLNLAERKLTAPPPELRALLENMARAEDYATID
jgi:acyl-CoA thioester hydrolase